MKLQRILIALTIINIGLLAFLLSHPVTATQEVAQVLRGHSLEIVDDLGRVRASIALHAAHKLADGSIYPETVLLRLINEDGRPNIKLSAMTGTFPACLSVASSTLPTSTSLARISDGFVVDRQRRAQEGNHALGLDLPGPRPSFDGARLRLRGTSGGPALRERRLALGPWLAHHPFDDGHCRQHPQRPDTRKNENCKTGPASPSRTTANSVATSA